MIATDGQQNPFKFIRKHCSKNKYQPLTSITTDEGRTLLDLKECVTYLTDKLLLTDSEREDTRVEWREMRRLRDYPPPTEDILPPTIQQLRTHLNTMKLKKSPGLDGLTTELVKSAWGTIEATLHKLFLKIYEQGIFPRVWKCG
jgi:hypothetical protein